jgi:hypothetical protein
MVSSRKQTICFESVGTRSCYCPICLFSRAVSASSSSSLPSVARPCPLGGLRLSPVDHLGFGVQPILNVVPIFSATLLVQFVCTTTDLIHNIYRRFFGGRVGGRNWKSGFTLYWNSFLGLHLLSSSNFWFYTRNCKNAHSTRLSEKRRIRSW